MSLVGNWRAIMGPRGMGRRRRPTGDALRKVIETAEWKADLGSTISRRAQFRKDLDKDYADAESVFVELGLAKH